MKRTILHIIDNLGRGGAETMLVNVVKQLNEYNNIIVTLHPENEFEEELKCDQLICLNLKSRISTLSAAHRLRKIIRENNVCMVHSHLFWSTVVARLGVPKDIPLVTTIHAFVASSIEYRPLRMRLMEKLTYKIRKSTIVAVAKGALQEYFSFIDVKPHQAYHLYTFVDTAIFNEDLPIKKKEGDMFRIVTVGNLKEQKNHRFLLDAFQELREENISLDIYGKGPLHDELQQTINEEELNITLKGQVKNIQEELKQYDLFVMSSFYEGFALSVLEAMALALPLLLSDIVSFKEQCEGTAAYFNLQDPKDFASKLRALKEDPEKRHSFGAACRQRVLQNFTLQKHIQQLKAIYTDTLDQVQPGIALSFAK